LAKVVFVGEKHFKQLETRVTKSLRKSLFFRWQHARSFFLKKFAVKSLSAFLEDCPAENFSKFGNYLAQKLCARCGV
jgi:hypothetical protein